MRAGGGRNVIFLIPLVAILLCADVFAAVLTLPEGLKLATENGRLLKIAAREEAVSSADTLIERAKMLPEVNAYASGTALAYQPGAIFGNFSVPTAQKDFYSYGFDIQQTLYDFKKNSSRYQKSLVLLDAKKLDTQRIRNLVALDFGLSYFDLLESEKMILVGEREVERLRSHLRDAQNLYEEGVITKNDLLQAEVRISDATQRLLTAKSVRRVNASRLNSVLVRPLTSEVEVMDVGVLGVNVEGIPADVTDMEFQRAWDIAEVSRPEIKIVEETMKSLDLEEQVQKADYYPVFFTRGSYDFSLNRYMTHEGNWALIVGMTINLYKGGSTKAHVLKVEEQKRSLKEQQQKLIDDVRLEVEKSLLDAQTAKERIRATKDAVEQAEENLRINNAKYEEGVGTATDVLDAVTLLTVAETNYYKAVYDLDRAGAAVLYSMGIDISEVYR